MLILRKYLFVVFSLVVCLTIQACWQSFLITSESDTSSDNDTGSDSDSDTGTETGDVNYQWHTFYGAYFGDFGKGIAVDGTGDVIVIGGSSDSWNGPDDESPVSPYASGYDDSAAVFAVKLDSDGDYLWHTFHGKQFSPANVTTQNSGEIIITGSSYDWSGPGNEPPLNGYAGEYDGSIMRDRLSMCFSG